MLLRPRPAIRIEAYTLHAAEESRSKEEHNSGERWENTSRRMCAIWRRSSEAQGVYACISVCLTSITRRFDLLLRAEEAFMLWRKIFISHSPGRLMNTILLVCLRRWRRCAVCTFVQMNGHRFGRCCVWRRGRAKGCDASYGRSIRSRCHSSNGSSMHIVSHRRHNFLRIYALDSLAYMTCQYRHKVVDVALNTLSCWIFALMHDFFIITNPSTKLEPSCRPLRLVFTHFMFTGRIHSYTRIFGCMTKTKTTSTALIAIIFASLNLKRSKCAAFAVSHQPALSV